jgi:arginyl-tRNA synthetase
VSDQLRLALQQVARALGGEDLPFVLERPRDATHGDLATNLALLLARPRKANPRAIAQEILDSLALPEGLVRRTEIAGPGFINFWLAGEALAGLLTRIIREGSAYGRSASGAACRVNVEFVSANPTGPLHVGHGRGAALGDAIAALLEWTGHEVTREFYINDAGVQIDRLAESLWARVQEAAGRPAAVPEGGYHGDYLREAAARLLEAEGGGFADLAPADGIALCRRLALRLQRAEQDALLADFGVHFDHWISEQALYDDGRVQHALEVLAERGLTYEQDGALWMRTSDFGDDKDRVLRKSDGSLTYLVPDIAYHINKHERGFDRAINVWGADHHGYIPRMRSVLAALGYEANWLEITLVQLVKVTRGGEEVKMSKRSGQFVTLRDLIDDVGTDAARYFFLMRRGETPFTFDVDLARAQTEENPVFYVQMAHARLSGIFRVAHREIDSVGDTADLGALTAPDDVALLKKLTVFPDLVARAARNREPHQVTGYLEELAQVVHAWYHNCRVLGEPPATEHGRLVLARATRQVLANGLAILGLSAPDRM